MRSSVGRNYRRALRRSWREGRSPGTRARRSLGMNFKSRGTLRSAQCPLVIAPYGPACICLAPATGNIGLTGGSVGRNNRRALRRPRCEERSPGTRARRSFGVNFKSRGTLLSAQCPLVIAPYGPACVCLSPRNQQHRIAWHPCTTIVRHELKVTRHTAFGATVLLVCLALRNQQHRSDGRQHCADHGVKN